MSNAPHSTFFGAILHWSDRRLFWAGMALYTLCAWFSMGYFHPDEHFQLLEFAAYKLGITPARDLAWEFGEQIRPSLQPWLAAGLIRASRALGLQDPLIQAFLLRWITAMLSLALYFRFTRVVAREFKRRESVAWFRLGLIFLWFMPFLSVRFSSESWAGLTLGVALIMLYSDTRDGAEIRDKRALVIGFLLGIACLFRMQMIFSILGIAGWLWVYYRPAPKTWWLFLAGGLNAFSLGALADAAFYGDWVFTPWNYFKINIIQGKAAGEFGVSPWWFYLPEFLVRAAPPLSLLLLTLFGMGWYRRRRDLFAWVILAFLIPHCIVGHKEMRFLFPVVLPFLYYVALGWEEWQNRFSTRWWSRWTIRLSLLVNGALLLYVCTQPAGDFMPCFRYLYDTAAVHPRVLYVEKTDPYELVGIKGNFYRPPQLDVRVVRRFDLLDEGVLHPGDLLLSQRLGMEKPPPGCTITRVFTHFPNWVLRYDVNRWQERSRMWSIYEVKAVEGSGE